MISTFIAQNKYPHVRCGPVS